MLIKLLRIRIRGLLSSLTKTTKSGKSSLPKAIFIGLICLLVLADLLFLLVLFLSRVIKQLVVFDYAWLYFALLIFIIFMFSFISSIFTCMHELYYAKDNDLLLSMPIKNHTILGSRLAMVLLINYFFSFGIGLPAYFVYCNTSSLSLGSSFIYFIVLVTLPLFIASCTCLFSWLLAIILSKLKYKNTFLFVAYIGGFMAYFYFIQNIGSSIMNLLVHGKQIAQAIKQVVFPLYHASFAIYDASLPSLLIYLLCCIVPFILTYTLLSSNFDRLCIKKQSTNTKVYKGKKAKVSSLYNALIKRELRHMFSNPMVLFNTCSGLLLSVFAVGYFIFKINELPSMEELAPIVALVENHLPAALCMQAIFFQGTTYVCSSSISIEGPRIEIVKTLPIPTMDIFLSKICVHVLFTIPIAILSIIVFGFYFKVSFFIILLCIFVSSMILLSFGLLGLLFNLLKPKFDWVNETACVKRGLPVFMSLFSSLAILCGLGFIYFKLFFNYNSILFVSIVGVVFVIINSILYQVLRTWGVTTFEQLKI